MIKKTHELAAALARKQDNLKLYQGQFGPSLCNIQCFCGHEADIQEFCRTLIAGELPAGHYQCPVCRRAWQVRKTPIRVTAWGSVISAPSQIVTVLSLNVNPSILSLPRLASGWPGLLS